MPSIGHRTSLALVVVALAGCAGAGPSSGSPTTAATGQSPAASGPVGSPSASPVWTPTPSLGSSRGTGRTWTEPAFLTAMAKYGSVTAVAAGPDRWVAVGAGQDWEEDATGGLHFLWNKALVWTSPDGKAWTPVADDPVFEDASMFGVQWTSRGFIALGHWKDERPNPNGVAGATEIFGSGPAAWLSTDGLVWTALAAGPRGTAEDQGRMNAVAEVDGQIVAVGCLDEPCLFGPAVWILDQDGFRLAKDSPPRGPAAAYDVIDTSAGMIAVGGTPSFGGEPQRAAVWASSDGDTWTSVTDIEVRDAGVMRAVTGTPKALVAVGSTNVMTGPLRPAVWTSRDSGATWQEAGRENFIDDAGIDLFDVVFTGQAIVAVGWNQGEPWRAVAWLSNDATNWERIDLPGTGSPAVSIADGPGGLVAVGGYLINGGLASWTSPAGAQ